MALRRDELTVRMFGPLRLELADRTLGSRDLGGIKPRQLLEVLLLERGRPVSKDRIADCLWTERLPGSTSGAIETYVSQLRRVLGRGLIRTETAGYQIPMEAVSTDVDAFDALVRDAAATRGKRRQAALRAALDVAEGELLADEPYPLWVLGPREHYRVRRLQAELELAESCIELGEYDAAWAVADEVLTGEPTSERAHRVGMLAAYRAGDRAAALRRYARCRAELDDALGVPPSAQTTVLYEEILLGAVPAHAPAAPIRYADSLDVRIATSCCRLDIQMVQRRPQGNLRTTGRQR